MSGEPKQKRKAFKEWFDQDAAEALAQQISSVYDEFDVPQFVASCTADLDNLEFHDRVRAFSDSLRASLPKPVPEALSILTKSLPETLPDCETVTDGWLQWPVGKFIADYGLDYFDEAFAAMIELTKRFSSEFAVRPFLEHYPDQTISRLKDLTSDSDAHVRRWCSEGTRPLLPWGKKLHFLIEDPSPVLPILESLKNDQERYVARSVANHLNDISKNNPDLVVAICQRWSSGACANRKWLIKHALRTLLKQGHRGALEILGFGNTDAIAATLKVEPPIVSIGGSLILSASITNEGTNPSRLMLDYLVHFVKKSGSTSPKVFKWREVTLEPGETMEVQKKHSFKPVTTRVLYSGTHQVQLQINGSVLAGAEFELT